MIQQEEKNFGVCDDHGNILIEGLSYDEAIEKAKEFYDMPTGDPNYEIFTRIYNFDHTDYCYRSCGWLADLTDLSYVPDYAKEWVAKMEKRHWK